jgi:hypothetical protein
MHKAIDALFVLLVGLKMFFKCLGMTLAYQL